MSRTNDRIAAKIVEVAELRRRLAGWRLLSERIVFTNGCFDLIHPGHLTYLAQARDLGHRLVVGLNDDASVRRLKGPQRPVMPEAARAQLLASLFFVDAVVLFSEDTPRELIEQVRPDVLVKGSDYRPEEVVGADFVQAYGGRLELLSFVDGYSTTETIRRMQE